MIGGGKFLVLQASKTNVTNSDVIHACLCLPSSKAEAKDNVSGHPTKEKSQQLMSVDKGRMC